MKLPDYIIKIMDVYEKNGYLCYVVGGAVRDSLLNLAPSDFDLTTNALPHISMEMFDRTIDTGLKHGTITIMLDGNAVEVTTFRIDGDYKDNRHPESVTFTSDVKEDLARRDFTVNSIAYNKKEGYVDFFGGISDLEKKIIRAVGNPNERFMEDGLRMIRAIRFSAKLGFSIHTETFKAIKDLCHLIENISEERIKDELDKILMSKKREYISYLYETKLINYINVPPLCYEKSQIERIVNSLHCYMGNNLAVCYALWFMYVPQKDLKSVMQALKFDNKTLNEVLLYNREMLMEYELNAYNIRKTLCRTGYEALYNILDIKAIIMDSFHIDGYKSIIDEIVKSGDPITLKHLAITGESLKELGLKGAEIGKCLNYLLDMVHKEPSQNDGEKLIEIARSKL